MSKVRNSWLLLVLLALFIPGMARAEEASGTLTWDGLLAQARVLSPSLGDSARSLAAAKESATTALAVWKSSLTLGGKYSGSLEGGATASTAPSQSTPGGSSTVTGLDSSYTASLTVKPLEQVSIQSSLDNELAVKVSATVQPFASTSQVDNARNSLSDEELRWTYNRDDALRTLRNLYANWAKARSSVASSILDRDIKARALKTEEIKYEAGAGSTSTLDEASSNYLEAFKKVLEQELAEEKARVDLLVAAGLGLDAILADPVVPEADALEARATNLLEGKDAPRASLAAELAKRTWQRAELASGALPGFLQGLSFGGGIDGTLASGSKTSPSWNASVSFSLGADTFNGAEAASRERNLASALAAYRKAQAQAELDAHIAKVNLQSARSLLTLTKSLYEQSKVKYQAELIKAENGSASAASVDQARASLAKAQANYDGAVWDLEKAVQAWD